MVERPFMTQLKEEDDELQERWVIYSPLVDHLVHKFQHEYYALHPKWSNVNHTFQHTHPIF